MTMARKYKMSPGAMSRGIKYVFTTPRGPPGPNEWVGGGREQIFVFLD